jgi:hypothetical protein
MKVNGVQWLFRCDFCKKLFFSPKEAEICCRKVKTLISDNRLAEDIKARLAEEHVSVNGKVFGNGNAALKRWF